MMGRAPVTPSINKTQYNKIANNKFAIGPADTMAMRFHTLCRLNARCNSGSEYVVLGRLGFASCSAFCSLSSSILTKPPSGMAANTNSVLSLPKVLVSNGLPNPIEKRSTFTLHQRAT